MNELSDMPSTAADQVELFPIGDVEAAELFLTHFQDDVDKAEKALGNAAAKLREAKHLRDVAEGNLLRVRSDAGFGNVAQAVADALTGQAETIEDAEVLEITAGDIDPITGEPETAGYADVGRLAPDVPDFTPCVVVLWPGDDEPHATEIGEHTTYLELVADYCSAVDGFAGGLDDFAVTGEDDGAERRLDDVIADDDYGHRFTVVAREAARA